MIALGGILAAPPAIICLYLAVHLPTNRLFFHSLASYICFLYNVGSGV